MHKRSARLLIAGTAVVGALAAGAAPASAQVPASAADVRVDMYLRNSTVPAARAGVLLSPTFYSPTPVTVDGLTVAFDASGLAGVATIADDDDSDCTEETATRLVCSVWFPVDLDSDGQGVFDIMVKAAAGAKPGATGTLKATLTATGIEPVTREAAVRVAKGVDLAAGDEVSVRAEPGGTFDAPLTVRNAGRSTVDGVTVMFHGDFALRAGRTFSNCTYVGDRPWSCTFDQRLAPGKTYRLTVPYRLRADAYAPGSEYSQAQWLTPAEHEDHLAYLTQRGYDIGKPGNGGVLALTAVAKTLRAPQTDTNPDNNWSNLEVTVTGKQGADLIAVGDRVAGAVGTEVTATVGVRNEGPATIDWGRSGEHIAHISVTVPPGSTVLTVPPGCRQTVDGAVDWEQPVRPGAGAYVCFSGYLLQAGTATTFDFGLRIDTVIPNAAGAITVNEPCECSYFQDDLDLSNNRAALLINGTA